MYFFTGRLGKLERMMNEKPGYHRRSGNSGKPYPQKKPMPKKAVDNSTVKRKDDSHDG